MKRVLTAMALALSATLCMAQAGRVAFNAPGDLPALAAGIGAAAASEFCLKLDAADRQGLASSQLSPIDSLICRPYDDGLSKASLGCLGAELLLPGVLAAYAGGDELLGCAAAYSESLLWTYAAKNGLKRAFPKARPYERYATELTGGLYEDSGESFPSGHAALAFCAATSFAVLSGSLIPDRPERPWLVGGGYALAVGVAALRVGAGEHYLTDVAAGALLGSAIGYAVTVLHLRASEGAAGGMATTRAAPATLGPGLVITIRQ
jgi:membrane-associated phospholipid phosphatase